MNNVLFKWNQVNAIHEICDTANIFDNIFPRTIFESHLKYVSTIGDQSAPLPFGYLHLKRRS